MASTGAYRQALQQLFAIQIEDEFSQASNGQPGSVHNFQNSGQNVSQPVGNTNANNVVNITDIQNNQTTNEITDNYIDNEFSSFFN